MRQWSLIDDRIVDAGIDVPYLGVPYQQILDGKVEVLPEDYDGWFPFTRMCNSIGDWGVISGLYEGMKKKYPNIKIARPNEEYLSTVLSPINMSKWNYNEEWPTNHNMELIMKDNPYIDYRFSPKEFSIVYNDHFRSYDKLIKEDGVIISDEEPLTEQIAKRFGFTNDDLSKIDLRPKLYFSEDEIQNAKSIVKKYGLEWGEYGCLLLAGRLEKFKSQWGGDEAAIPYVNRYKNTPVFCYSGWEVDGTFWGDLFPNRVDFDKENIPMRTQLCLKYFAKFNAGYQAGLTDAISGGDSDVIVVTPYKSLKENFIRGVQYVHLDGTTKKSLIYK